jgi:hypothetical protein
LEDKMTTVIGVFDNDSDLEVALNRLYDKGYNDVRVVDRSREEANTLPAATFIPGATTSNGASSAPNGVFPVSYLVPGFFGVADEHIDSAYLLDALGLDITSEEADFYTNAVRNNGKLLIVDTHDDKADQAWAIMRNSNGSQFVKAE